MASVPPAVLQAEFERCRQRTDAILLAPARREQFRPDHLRRAVYAYLERPAKRLRPALLVWCCRAAGGDEDQALPAAAAVEMIHTWTLVHDDVIDNDARRRGEPTVHVLAAQWAETEYGAAAAAAADYGRDVAILAGDAQQAWSQALLLECAERGVAPRLVLELVRRLQTDLTYRLLEGELLDVQLSLQPLETIDPRTVLEMVRLKTGALLGYAAAAGAAIGSGHLPGASPLVDGLAEFAELCGVAFQLQDDILGITGDEAILGKPVGSDLREGKATTPLLHTLRQASPAQRALLRRVLGNPAAPADEIAAAQRLIVDLGSIEATVRQAEEYLERARTRLHQAVPPSADRDLLEAWAEGLVARRR